jgi:predicted Zn-ribbon and HTH transcriptional regulator
MADVYKFRVTVDLSIATHEAAKTVRDFLTTFVEEQLADEQARLEGVAVYDPSTNQLAEWVPRQNNGPVEAILEVDVSAKRLDDWAPIGPDLTLRIKGATCPHCRVAFADHVINRMPFTCPACKRIIRVDGDGQVMG